MSTNFNTAQERLCHDCLKPGPIFCYGSDGEARCPECHEMFLIAEKLRTSGRI
jgi:hypothetical protein